MRILVLGGTAWLGGEVAAEAVRRGHQVTCLARGESGEVPEGVALVRADRNRPDALDSVLAARWDAVVDVARQPGHVRRAAAALEQSAARFLLVSTGNVYADHRVPGADERTALLPPLEADEMASMEQYGEAKVACEAAVLAAFGAERALIARAGLIGGPGDTSGRSGYWPWRFAHPSGGAVLVPDAESRASQLIDVRDLAAWLVLSAEDGTTGAFDAVGPTVALGDHLATARTAVGYDGALATAPEAWLREQGVGEWMGSRTLPLWLVDPDYSGFAARTGAKARAAGLTHRPLEETLLDVLAWEEQQPAHPHGAGLSDEEELALLAVLRSTSE